jgi:hypothetical protein
LGSMDGIACGGQRCGIRLWAGKRRGTRVRRLNEKRWVNEDARACGG